MFNVYWKNILISDFQGNVGIFAPQVILCQTKLEYSSLSQLIGDERSFVYVRHTHWRLYKFKTDCDLAPIHISGLIFYCFHPLILYYDNTEWPEVLIHQCYLLFLSLHLLFLLSGIPSGLPLSSLIYSGFKRFSSGAVSWRMFSLACNLDEVLLQCPGHTSVLMSTVLLWNYLLEHH